ncbi:hypothetical protein ACFL38_05375 [Candidatus Omnitrophota bacterium]
MTSARKQSKKQAFTFVEILIAIVIIVGLFLAILHNHTISLRFVKLTREKTIAHTHAQSMVEAMLARIETGTGAYDFTDYFPHQVQDGPSAPLPDYHSLVGGYGLPAEHITINYTNLNWQTDEILDTSVKVEWDSATAAGHSKSFLRTLIKK